MTKIPEQNHNNNVKPYKVNRRVIDDRRSFGSLTQFPFINSADKVIEKDRRFIPDRRIANIVVKAHFLHIKSKSLKLNEVI